MKQRIVVATRNRGKVAELVRMLGDLSGVELVSVADFPDVPDVVEDGATFEHNARKKAREVARATRLPALADDSGLEVDALSGAPGVYSARYAGERAGDAANNAKLLAALRDVPDAQRTARFRCVLAFADPSGPLGEAEHVVDGTCEGRIAHAPKGSHGFGYDPLFVLDGGDRTLAELGPDVKDRVSHRAAAARAMRGWLADYLRRR